MRGRGDRGARERERRMRGAKSGVFLTRGNRQEFQRRPGSCSRTPFSDTLPMAPIPPSQGDLMAKPRLSLVPGGGPFDPAGMHIYMIGIGGCGMAGLARMLACRRAVVGGSDVGRSETTALLESEGIRVGFDQARGWLPEACDLVI